MKIDRQAINLKWDLDDEKAIEGKPTRRLLDLIRELETEGLL